MVADGQARGPAVGRLDAALALLLAGGAVTLAFITNSSSDPSVPVAGGFAWSEIAATALGAVAIAVAVAIGGRGRLWGAGTVALFTAFTALAALSIAWSVVPDWSWYGADQLLCCLSAFAGAAALARVFPQRWRALVGSIAIASTAVCGWALLVKVFPGTLGDPNNHYGRLLEPFGYWNALGLAAAIGLPACMWAAARREGPRAARALAVTALTIGIAVVVLSYSRSAALAAVVGIVCSLVLGRRRLSSALMLGLGAVGAVPLVAWALHDHSLTSDNVALSSQRVAGHGFGLVLIAVLALVTVAGWLAARETDRRTLSPSLRRRIHRGLAALGALAVLAVLGALASSHRGLTGEISHEFNRLTSIQSNVGDTSARLTQLDSSRPLYWHEGIEVGVHNLLAGAGELAYGVARLRYTTNPDVVHQAHSWLVQTFADLGLIGLVLTLALLAAWALAAARPLGLRGDPAPARGDPAPVDPAPAPGGPATAPGDPGPGDRGGPRAIATEREGMVALAAIAVCFGVQSTLDWTWYYLGVTLPALACAGWLAGRGPLAAPVGRRPGRAALLYRMGALAAITAVVAGAVIAGWLMWEPLRSAQAASAAIDSPTYAQALGDARTAANSNPLSVAPLFLLSDLYAGLHEGAAARAQLVDATRLQPENPQTWWQLGTFDLHAGRPRPALAELRRVLTLDQAPLDTWRRQAAAEIPQAQAAIAAAHG